ncbi:unnamed protein product, partial [marine sediment metagenome]
MKMRQFVMKMLAGMMMLGMVCLWLSSCAAASVTDRGISVRELHCEYAQNPLGIDAPHPRFSWLLESTRRGQRQTAYQVLVATAVEKLNNNIGDKWDSGKVVSE